MENKWSLSYPRWRGPTIEVPLWKIIEVGATAAGEVPPWQISGAGATAAGEVPPWQISGAGATAAGEVHHDKLVI